MSYILDALRRAQAERGRGSVPGLHTPASPVGALPTAAAAARGPRGGALLWVALALGAGLAAAVWWLWRAPPPAAVVVAASVAPAVPAPPAPQAAPVPAAVPAPAPAPAAAREARPARRAAPERAAVPPAAPKEAPKEAPKPAASAAAATPVFAQGDLPPSVREQLPTLQLAGVTYSANPLHRMVIVNGQVLHEGDAAAPGLVLERIEPGRTVWAFRGYRYALPSQ